MEYMNAVWITFIMWFWKVCSVHPPSYCYYALQTSHCDTTQRPFTIIAVEDLHHEWHLQSFLKQWVFWIHKEYTKGVLSAEIITVASRLLKVVEYWSIFSKNMGLWDWYSCFWVANHEKQLIMHTVFAYS